MVVDESSKSREAVWGVSADKSGYIGKCKNTLGWVVLRSQSLEGPETQSKEPSIQQKDTLFAKDWCEDADDWGGDRDEPQGQTPPPPITSQATSCSAVSQQMDCVSLLEDLSLSDGSGGTGSPDVVFRSYYVAVADEEDCACNGDLDHVQHLLRDYEKREGLPHEEEESSTGKGECEKYEKSNLKTPDLVFHKFLKKIAPCTQQILRYSWNGSPLYMSPPAPASHPPPCRVCGGRRVFEFQLMPALVSMLHGAGKETLLEFGTVLVFTCERSCWAPEDRVSVQEFCFVQEDPDQKYFD
ncbi:programmed cell death protein 2-like [Discoglossus pictus]